MAPHWMSSYAEIRFNDLNLHTETWVDILIIKNKSYKQPEIYITQYRLYKLDTHIHKFYYTYNRLYWVGEAGDKRCVRSPYAITY